MTPDPSTAKMEISEVRKVFRWEKSGVKHELLALDGVNVDIQEGEFLSVIGPSGCGKTTLLRIVAGVTDHDGGQVVIDGQPVVGPGPERAMVFQSFGLFPWKTVLENVTFPLEIRKMEAGEVKEIAHSFLSRVGLDGFEDVMPSQLSGGMQQRVGLARALATDPDILLMDEPFGSIDAQTREYMQEELLKLWGESQKTVLFVTHDLDEAVLLADRVVVLTRAPGRVRASIPIDLPRPRWEYDARVHKNFAEVRQEIWQMLRSDIEEAEGVTGDG